MHFIAVLLITFIFLIGCAANTEKQPYANQEIVAKEGGNTMKLISNAFNNGDFIPKKYTCQGSNINPQLTWSDIPKNTKSFALIIDDPDAPAGTWTHWIVKDIPSDKTEIKENSIPGKEIVNLFNKEHYGGPCPPSGIHRYFFKLYALDIEIINANNKAEFDKEIAKHKLAEAVLIGKYAKT